MNGLSRRSLAKPEAAAPFRARPARAAGRRLLACFLALAALLAGARSATAALPADSLLLRSAEATATGRYGEARRINTTFVRALEGDPRAEPWRHLLEVSIRLSEMLDYGDTLGLGAYSAHLDSSRRGFSSLLARAAGGADSAGALYGLGSLEGFEASRLAEQEGALKALGPARRSARLLREALERDSTLVDAEAGIALYDYGAGRALRFLTWTPLLRDRRREAIASLERVVREGSYGRYLAAISLAWIYIEEGDPLPAAALADSFLAALGEARAFLEPCGKAYFVAERWAEARDRYDRLVAVIRSAPRRNPVRETGALHRLAHIAKAQEDWRGVLAYCEQALALPLNDEQRDRKHADLRRLRKLREEALGRLAGR